MADHRIGERTALLRAQPGHELDHQAAGPTCGRLHDAAMIDDTAALVAPGRKPLLVELRCHDQHAEPVAQATCVVAVAVGIAVEAVKHQQQRGVGAVRPVGVDRQRRAAEVGGLLAGPWSDRSGPRRRVTCERHQHGAGGPANRMSEPAPRHQRERADRFTQQMQHETNPLSVIFTAAPAGQAGLQPCPQTVAQIITSPLGTIRTNTASLPTSESAQTRSRA